MLAHWWPRHAESSTPATVATLELHACDASIRAALEAVAARFGGDWLGDFAAGVLAEDGL